MKIRDLVDIVLPKEVHSAANQWMNYCWKVVTKSGVIYDKPKTYENCWRKFGMIGSDGMIDTTNPNWRQYKFPLISDMKEAIEKGSNGGLILSDVLRMQQVPHQLSNELYRILPTINWKNYRSYRGRNFIGSPWFTHAWNAKGVNFGDIGWKNDWIFNFTENPVGSNPKGLSLEYLIAGSNMMKVHFRFSPGVRIVNAQGMFKALQVYPLVHIEDHEGRPLVSTPDMGFSPFVMTEMFKQTAELTIKDDGSWINWSNCHSAAQFFYDNWAQTKITSFNNFGLGSEAQGNIFVPGYPDGRGSYPNYNRSNWQMFSNSTIRVFEPLIDARYLTPSQLNNANDGFFAGGSNLVSIRIKNLNNSNWDFRNSKFDRESIDYLLRNVWDIKKLYRPFDDSNREEVLSVTCALVPEGLSITLPKSYFTDMPVESQESVRIATERGWNVIQYEPNT